MSQCQIVSNDILLEFLEIAFNEILYTRKLYPIEIFERKKIYGIGAHISQHPELNEYIKNILETITELLKHDDKCVKNVNLVIYNTEKIMIEKYVFHLFQFQFDVKQPDPYFLRTEEGLRTMCLKLSMTNAHLEPLPDDCTFTIEIDTYEAAHIAINENPKCENFPWILKESIVQETNAPLTNDLLPVTTIKTEHLGLQLFVVTPSNSEPTNE